MHNPGHASLFDRKVHFLLGLPFDSGGQDEVLKLIRHHIRTRQQCFLSTPNLNWIIASLKDRNLRDSVLSSDLVVPDGMPLLWIARLLGIPLKERVAGSNLFEALGRENAPPTRVFFFGGAEGVAEAACRKLAANKNGLVCAGFHYPGFGSVDEMSSDAVIRKINDSGADFLVISLGAKKGQAWIQHNKHRITVPVISHLGAVVNFIAGTVSRAPLWMQKTGLEWLWRIKEEPALWQRYFHDGLGFLRLCCLKVTPNILINFRRRFSGETLPPPSVAVKSQASGTCIRFTGDCTGRYSDIIKPALQEAATSDQDVQIFLDEPCSIDSHFTALLALLQARKQMNGRKFSIRETGLECRARLNYACADFLFTE